MAVFLAALDRVRGESDHREICLGTVARLRRDIDRRRGAGPAASRRHAPGGVCGLGSVIYGLALLGDLLGEPSLLLDACAACQLLDASELAREDRFDVMFGLAGLLLSLLALDRFLEGSPPAAEAAGTLPLELAALCAERLTAFGVAARSGGVPPGPGYSHGAAGASHALAAFAARTGDGAALEEASALLEAAAWELTAEASPRGSWCNGAAGHCVAWLACATAGGGATAPPPPLLHSIEHAPAAHDHLCCGWAGRADVLLHTARFFPAPRLEAAARRIGAGLLERHHEARLRFPHPEIHFEPRLLRGPIGVGYALLRLSDPRTVPCLLAFE